MLHYVKKKKDHAVLSESIRTVIICFHCFGSVLQQTGFEMEQ